MLSQKRNLSCGSCPSCPIFRSLRQTAISNVWSSPCLRASVVNFRPLPTFVMHTRRAERREGDAPAEPRARVDVVW